MDATPKDWADAAVTELGDALTGAFDVVELAPGSLVAGRDTTVSIGDVPAPVRLTKRLRLGGDRREPTLELGVDVENTGSGRVDARLGIEWTTTMLGGGGNPAAWWELRGERSRHDASGQAAAVQRLAQGNDFIGIAIETTVSSPADAWWAPVETISNSEQGFERVYQGSGLLLSWPIELAPGARWSVVLTNAVTTARDRALDA
jgi:alpha-amylase